MNTPTPPDELVAQLTEIVAGLHRENESASNNVRFLSAKILVDAVKAITPLIGADTYREFVETHITACLDPNVCLGNITDNKLDSSEVGQSTDFERSLNLQGLTVYLACCSSATPSPRLYLYVVCNDKKELVTSATLDVAATDGYDAKYQEGYLYSSALEHCNGCLTYLRPLGNAIIQFGAGAVEDATQLDDLAQNNPNEYTARYLLGLPASLKEILRQAVGKNEECDTI